VSSLHMRSDLPVDAATSGVAVSSQEAWVLAPLIAGAPTYRLGRWIGSRFQYPRPANPLKITTALPDRPAAVMIHGADGTVSTLCIDLDTSKAQQSVVNEDAQRLGTLFARQNVSFVEDFSPSGGRHLYIPLQERLSGSEARELIEALGRITPSLDPSPHQNLTDGCIRVPGAAHKSGGHQILITPLNRAYDVMRRRNTPEALERLKAALAPELRRGYVLKSRLAKASEAPHPMTPLPHFAAGSESELRRTARTGVYDTARYASASEARMAVLNHFCACGWTLSQVQTELTGQFPGLTALYGTPAKRERLLGREWAKAQSFVGTPNRKKTRGQKRGENPAFINNTSPTKTTGGGTDLSSAATHQLVNDLENVLYTVLDDRLKQRGREGLSLRLLIRGLLGYMRTKQTNLLDVGCRTLAVALGKHHVTVARLLPILVKASDGILTKVAEARYKTADVYLIQLPAHYEQLARELSWRKGKIHAVRPVFRALGDAAALVYETIERSRYSPTTADIIRTTGISRSATDHALAAMTTLAMIHREGRHWKVTSATNLTDLALRLGVLDDYQAQISRNRRERARWHAYLDRFKTAELQSNEIYDPEIDEYWLPPDATGEPWAHILAAA
jgi:hypothetical protein